MFGIGAFCTEEISLSARKNLFRKKEEFCAHGRKRVLASSVARKLIINVQKFIEFILSSYDKKNKGGGISPPFFFCRG
jgi:hypothetical protein